MQLKTEASHSPKGDRKHQEKNSAEEEGKKAPTKKEKGGGKSQQGKHPVKKCVDNCKAGRNSGCPFKARGRGK